MPAAKCRSRRSSPRNGSTATEIDYRPYGVRLAFTPIVLDNGLVNLNIEPEVSEIDRSVTVNGNPGFISRKANATIELRDGQSFAMAGLLQSVNASDVQQLPWLGQIPVLGALFRSTSFQKRESDLVIVVTPRIVRPSSPDEKLASPLDQTRPGNDVEMFLLGMLEVDKKMIAHLQERRRRHRPLRPYHRSRFRGGVCRRQEIEPLPRSARACCSAAAPTTWPTAIR